jgi:hypothetical protein
LKRFSTPQNENECAALKEKRSIGAGKARRPPGWQTIDSVTVTNEVGWGLDLNVTIFEKKRSPNV